MTHWTLVKTSLTCCDKMVLDFGKQLQNIDMEMLRGTKFGSGARALAVKPDDDTVYLVGTEEGLIHLCTTEYASKYLATFQAHNTPVRKIEITTILSAVHKSGLHSGVEHIPAKCVHQLRGGVERQDLGHEQLLAPLHFRCQVTGRGRGLGPLLQV